MNRKRLLAWLLSAAMLLGTTGCAAERGEKQAETEPRVPVTEMTLTNQPAQVLTGVETDKKVISLIFEGFSDAQSMEQIIRLMEKRKVDCVFFLSGVTVAEQPEIVRQIRSAGLTLGNYGMTGQKQMEDNGPEKNLRQFERAQEQFEKVCGTAPSLFRCNASQYTQELLQAADAAGLSAGVQPDGYLNHRSFSVASDANVYVQRLVRGSILSVKLGQELDSAEYGQVVSIQEMRPAIDPPPGISDADDDIPRSIYETLATGLEWLLDALEAEGYTIVSPRRLQAEAVDLFAERELTADEEAVLRAAYDLPVTASPLSSVPTQEGTLEDLDGSVFVGDSVMAGLEGYVKWREETAQAETEQAETAGTESRFPQNMTFLTDTNLSVESNLMRVSEDSVHPTLDGQKVTISQGIKASGAKRAYLMLPSVDPTLYLGTKPLTNMKLTLYLIQKENPQVQLCVVSYPPNRATPETTRTNEQIFRYNLELYRLCCQLDIPYLDAASVLRDETGALAQEYCIDLRTYGTHLNDAGCEAVLTYLTEHIPAA